MVADHEETQALVVAEQPAPVTVFGTDEPTGIVQRTTAIADALADVIKSKKMSVNIQGREYVKAEGWSFLGSMLGVFPRTSYVQPMESDHCEEEHPVCGYEAAVELVTRDGSVVGGAIAECSRHERSWANRDDYALKSMAQTRATGKAYRMGFGFVMASAGYEATPAEEMTYSPAEDRKLRERTERTRQAYAKRDADRASRRQPDNTEVKDVGTLLAWANQAHGLQPADVCSRLGVEKVGDIRQHVDDECGGSWDFAKELIGGLSAGESEAVEAGEEVTT